MENRLLSLFESEKMVDKEFVMELISYLYNSDYDIKSINNIVKSICIYNTKLYEKLNIENKEYERILKNRKIDNINALDNNSIITDDNDVESDDIDNSLKIDISFYIEILNGIVSYDDVEMILPNKHTDNYQDIINLILLHYYEEYKMLEKILKDISEKDIDYKEYNNCKLECLKMINYIKEYVNKLNSSSENKSISRKNQIVFLKTSNDNICVKNDITKDMPSEFYQDVLEVVESIKDGTFKNVKSFNNYRLLTGLYEVKYHDVRLTFKRLSKDIYILIHAFVKKCYTSSQYYNMLESRYAIFKSQQELLLNQIQDDDFLELNNEILNEVEDILINKKEVESYDRKNT